jgi:DNA (cytosine-5)-methyltransferase 1
MREIIVDSFAGGGGASTGIERALGVSPDIAINHDAVALSMHEANHPNTRHLPHNIWKVDPLVECGGRPVGLLWASPDCKHFSKAKGGKPVEKSIRDLAWVVVRWAHQVQPRCIFMENVEEFVTWGPLGPDNRPCPDRKGQEFRRWIGELRKLGYKVAWRELRACDFGAPTIRKRFFLIARRDGEPIVWPKPTHGDPKSEAVKSGKLKPWRTAAEVIDWSLPCHSIFLTREEARAVGVKRPLAPATMARIAKGVKRYVLDAAKPFIVNLTHHGGERTESIDDPFMTVTGAHRGEKAIITPTLIQTGYGEREGQQPRVPGLEKPIGTVVAGGIKHALVAPHLMTMRNAQKPFNEADKPTHTITSSGAHLHLVGAFLAKHFGGPNGIQTPGSDLRQPVSTVTAQDHHALVAAHLNHQYSSGSGEGDPTKPARTVTADGNHAALVAAFMQKYYGTDQAPELEEPIHTATTKHRFGLVTVNIEGEPYVITDIGMRMLTPRELFRAQGFPDSYRIDTDVNGKPISKTDQVRMCGNSVCPPMAEALVRANFRPREVMPIEETKFRLEAAE